MNSRAFLLADVAPIVAAVEQRFLPGALRSRLDRDAAALPRALWEAALAGPLRDFLGREGSLLRARLVSTAFTLAGGRGEAPTGLGLVLEILHAGSLVIDDIEDGAVTRRGAPSLHLQHGVPLAINAGNWLYFWALSRIDEFPLSDAQKLAIHRLSATTLLRCHDGQALDLSVRVHELAQADVPRAVSVATSLKTGGLVELAARLGAIAADADGAVVAALGAFGQALGVALQMLDDDSSVTSDRRAHKGIEDVENARLTWPFAWLASDLSPMAYRKLRNLAGEVHARRAPAAELISMLRAELGTRGRERASAHLRHALAELRAALPEGSDLKALERDLHLLETRHV